MNEAKLTLMIRKGLDTVYGSRIYVRKIHGGRYSSGIPDLLGGAVREGEAEGFCFGMEVKLPGKEHTLTPLQESNLNAIEAAGGHWAVVTSVKEALAYMEEWMEG